MSRHARLGKASRAYGAFQNVGVFSPVPDLLEPADMHITAQWLHFMSQ